ncbi:MAG: hypothetical protein HFH86_02435 [Bacilli bacterium]|nr:hypothetical protein [Bacilli bacterium]
MKNKKGLYLLIAFVGLILVFFCILFFFHARTLENGILFKVSFEYENAQNISYHFYNQSGKIEKKEKDGEYEKNYFLAKTDYNSVKLLRKVIKGLKESKEKSNEEGITIYNGQNKKYYLLPYDSKAAEELSKYIIDGYIHSELNRVAKKELSTELYVYQDKERLQWTREGNQKRIIHTYQCETKECSFLYLTGEEKQAVIFDKVNYFYNYVTGEKEVINITEPLIYASFIKWNNEIYGINLMNEKKETAFYDLEKKTQVTDFALQTFQMMQPGLFFHYEQNKANLTEWTLQILKSDLKEKIWETKKMAKENNQFEIQELKSDLATYHILTIYENQTVSYQIFETDFQSLNEIIYQDLKFNENGNIIGVKKDGYDLYDENGKYLKTSLNLDELEMKKEPENLN